MSADFWTPERVDFLAKNWNDPIWSASRIGAHLGCTRNAAIGKAQRLGLSGPVRPARMVPHIPPKPPASPLARKEVMPSGANVRSNEAPETSPQPVVRAAGGEGRPVHFLDARDRQCRFPLWPNRERTGFVCGEPVVGTSSWCAACLRVVAVPREIRRRAA